MDTTPTKIEPPFVSDADFVELTKKVPCPYCENGRIEEEPCRICYGDAKLDADRHVMQARLRPFIMRVNKEVARLRTEHLTQLAERDKVIEGLRALLERARPHVESDRTGAVLQNADQWAATAEAVVDDIDERLSTLKALVGQP